MAAARSPFLFLQQTLLGLKAQKGGKGDKGQTDMSAFAFL